MFSNKNPANLSASGAKNLRKKVLSSANTDLSLQARQNLKRVERVFNKITSLQSWVLLVQSLIFFSCKVPNLEKRVPSSANTDKSSAGPDNICCTCNKKPCNSECFRWKIFITFLGEKMWSSQVQTINGSLAAASTSTSALSRWE